MLSILNAVCNKVFAFKGPADDETTNREVKFPISVPVTSAYAAAVTLAPVYRESFVSQAVSGALTLNVSTANADYGDRLIIKFTLDGTNRTITWGTGVAPQSATLAGTASNKYICHLFFNGTNWEETSRSAGY